MPPPPSEPDRGKRTEDLAGRTERGVAWVMFGAGAQIGVKLMVLAVLARLLTPADFGLIATGTMVIAFVQFASRFGVAPAIVQKAEIDADLLRAGFALGTLLGIGMFGALYLLAADIAGFFGFAGLTDMLRALSFTLVLAGICQVPEALLQRELHFKQLTLIEGVSFTLGYGGVSIGLALLGFGAWSLIAGLLCEQAIRAVLLLGARRFPIGLTFSMASISQLLRYGGGLSMVQLTNSLAYQADNLVVAKFMGAEAIGIYSRAYQVLTAPTKLIGNSLLKVLFPAMSRVQADQERLGRAFAQAIGAVLLVCLPASACLIVLAPEIVHVLLGGQWGGVVEPFRLLALAIAFRVGHKICEALLRARGHIASLWWRQVVYALSVLVFALAGQRYGLVGVSIGVALAVLMNFLLLLSLVLRSCGLRSGDLAAPLARHSMVAVVLGALMTGLAEWLRSSHAPPIAVLAGGGVLAAVAMAVAFRAHPGLLGPEGRFATEAFARFVRRKPKGAAS
jgi:PST family polysaccharide transporter